MIVMPRGLHVAELAIEKFLEAKGSLFIIGNGLAQEERNYLATKYKERFVNIGPMMHHFRVLDIIVRARKVNFGIIDFDCFILDRSILDDLIIEESETDVCTRSPFFIESPGMNEMLPDTFLLFLNVKTIKQLMKNYGITARLYPKPFGNKAIMKELNDHGFNWKEHEPEKDYFDTFRLLFMLAMSNGYVHSRRDLLNDNVARAFHVGAISKPQNYKSLYGFRGSLFWTLCLERVTDNDLKPIVDTYLPKLRSADLVKERSDFVDQLDHHYKAFIKDLFNIDLEVS